MPFFGGDNRNDYAPPWSIMVLMVKHTSKRKRSSSRYAKIQQSQGVALGTLADDTVVEGESLALTQDFYSVSTDINVSSRGVTGGEGPLQFGLASQELSVTEIKEYLDANPTSQTDVPAIEHSKRRVRIIGTIPAVATEEVYNDGRTVRVRTGWIVPAGKSIAQFWVRNRSGATLTTGAIILTQEVHHGNWR